VLTGRYLPAAVRQLFQHCSGIVLAGIEHWGSHGIPAARTHGRSSRVKDRVSTIGIANPKTR
jgi:hypothetical protein